MDIYTIQEEAYKRGYEAGVKSVTDNNVGGKVSPTDREKLIELLSDLSCNAEYCKDCEFSRDLDGCVRRQKEIIVDRLIANGLTFVTDKNVGAK